MRKRSKLAQNKVEQHDYNANDILSRMPDEIAVTILSKLPLKDAATTSLLSRHWRYMWCQTTRLAFEDDKTTLRVGPQPELRLAERNKYINWVNRIMAQHRSPSLEEFKIELDLDKYSKGAITKWIEFAISKNVHRLEINLRADVLGDYLDPKRNFVFPNKILDKILGISVRKQILNVPSRTPAKISKFKFLKSLTLCCVNINDDALGKFLNACPVLELLYIFNSFLLRNVKITGPTLAITSLEILRCQGLESVQISDSQLVYFKYTGQDIDLRLRNNPRIRTLSIGEGDSGIENNMFNQISSCIPYLEVLELNMYHPKQDMHLRPYPVFPRLKTLKMTVGAWNDESLLPLTWLARRCPNLKKLTIQLIWRTPTRIMRTVMRAKVGHLHRYLEAVEIIGFYGRVSDIELVLYFLDTCTALKEVVVDPFDQTVLIQNPPDNQYLIQQKMSRHNAVTCLVPRFASRPEVNLRIL